MSNKVQSFIFFTAFIFVFALTAAEPVKAGHAQALQVQIFSSSGELKSSFSVPTANEAGGAKIAVADLGTDGVPEIVIGNGLGNEPRVRIYRSDGTEIDSFLAYSADMGSGITVAVCDLDGNGVNSIVTGTQIGGGPHVRVFLWNGNEWTLSGEFFAYNKAFRGGVNLSCGDLDNDGTDELVTSPGPGGGPHVKVWKLKAGNRNLENEYFAYDAAQTDGVLTKVENGQVQEKIMSQDYGVVRMNGFVLSENTPFGIASSVSADIDNDGEKEIIMVPDRILFSEQTEAKKIVVDLSEQRLYAYEYGVLQNSFLVSTARKPWITPVGEHSVLAKVPYVNYSWSYGPGNVNNYDLGLIPWNLRIYPHIYIHYAPWHNNFGHTMSHGCINVNLANIRWVYDWAEEGIPVTVRE